MRLLVCSSFVLSCKDHAEAAIDGQPTHHRHPAACRLRAFADLAALFRRFQRLMFEMHHQSTLQPSSGG